MVADTTPSSFQPVTDDDLQALLDGRIDPAKRAFLEQRLKHQPLAEERLRGWRAQRDMLRNLHAQVLHEPLPTAIQNTLWRAAAARWQAHLWWHGSFLGVCVLLAFYGGWLTSAHWQPVMSRPQLAGAGAEFVRQAAVAHVLFTPEVKHPVEVVAADHDHLVQWLSKRLGKPLRVPELSQQGYSLLGGRLLPGGTAARAQFMYQHSNGTRLTLYIGALENTQASDETAFRFSSETPVPGFYWVDQGWGYALSGALPQDKLSDLTKSVYRQL
jgi:anti-sigma factor RsiW